MSFYRNAEGYYDPTAGEALSNIAKEEHRGRSPKEKHPGVRQYNKPDADLGDPYHALANAVIIQAVEDYRKARRYLRRHPHTPELEAVVAEQRQQERESHALTKEMRLLNRILRYEDILKEVEQFFHSDYFMLLSDVDGPGLLERLKKEAVE